MEANFTENLGREIQRKFNVNERTYRRWKLKGIIPDKYFKKNASPENQQIAINILRLRWLNIAAITGKSEQYWRDVKSGNNTIKEKEFESLVGQIKPISDLFQEFISDKDNSDKCLKEIMKEKKVKKYSLFDFSMLNRIGNGGKATLEEMRTSISIIETELEELNRLQQPSILT